MPARKCLGTRVQFPAPPLSDTPCGNAGRVSFWTSVETPVPQGLTTGPLCQITCQISPPFVSDKPVPTKRPSEIAKECGVSTMTVYRERKVINDGAGSG